MKWTAAFFFCCSLASGLSFVDSPFDSLNSKEISRLRTGKDTSPVSWAFASYFLAERWQLEGRPHRSKELWQEVKNWCRAYLKDRPASNVHSLAFAVCALTEVEIAKLTPPYPFLNSADHLELYAIRALEGGLSPADKNFFLGRLSLDPKSIFALKSLERSHPKLTSPLYGLSWSYLQRGQSSLSEKYRRLALARKDERALLRFSRKYPKDEFNFGLRPQLIASNGAGFGLAMTVFDDRIRDTDRSFYGLFSATTRGTYGAKLEYQDWELGGWWGLGVDFYRTRSVEDFFPLGMGSGATPVSTLDWGRTGVQLWAGARVSDFEFQVGWRHRGSALEGASNTGFTESGLSPGAHHHGPVIRAKYDTRNSRVSPDFGNVGSLTAYFPSLVSLNFSLWNFSWRSHFTFSKRHKSQISAGFFTATGDTRFPDFGSMSGTYLVPGIRSDRYRERNIAYFSAGHSYWWADQWGSELFATAATASSTLSTLLNSPRLGAGFALLVAARRGGAPARVEVGYFNNEWSLRALGSVRF